MLLEPRRMVANQQGVIEFVLSRVTSAVKVLGDPRGLPGAALDKFESHNVITIVGGRGSGKTSVLLTIASAIQRENPEVLVLDIVHPDQIASKWLPVAALVMSSVARSLATRHPRLKQNILNDEHLQLAKMRWALNIDETLQVVSRDSLNAPEWADRIFRLVTRDSDPADMFRTWLHEVLDQASMPLVLVPIDDADIAIDKADEIIDTVRTYLASPRVITLLAVDIPSLERRIRNKRLSTLPRVPEISSDKASSTTKPTFLFGLSPGEFQSAEAEAEQEYVENLLTKVLPPAGRCYLMGLSERERMHTPFRIPGQSPDLTVLDLLSDTARGSDKEPRPNITALVEAHPEIFSANIRTYANQFVMVADACRSYIAEAGTPDVEVQFDEYRARSSTPSGSSTQGPARVRIPPISSPDDYRDSRFHMALARAFLSGDEFAPLREHARRQLGVEIERFDTMHELTSFMLQRR